MTMARPAGADISAATSATKAATNPWKLEVGKLQLELDKVRDELKEAQSRVKDMRTSYLDQVDLVGTHEATISTHEATIGTLQDANRRYEDTVHAHKDTINRLREQMKSLSTKSPEANSQSYKEIQLARIGAFCRADNLYSSAIEAKNQYRERIVEDSDINVGYFRLISDISQIILTDIASDIANLADEAMSTKDRDSAYKQQANHIHRIAETLTDVSKHAMKECAAAEKNAGLRRGRYRKATYDAEKARPVLALLREEEVEIDILLSRVKADSEKRVPLVTTTLPDYLSLSRFSASAETILQIEAAVAHAEAVHAENVASQFRNIKQNYDAVDKRTLRQGFFVDFFSAFLAVEESAGGERVGRALPKELLNTVLSRVYPAEGAGGEMTEHQRVLSRPATWRESKIKEARKSVKHQVQSIKSHYQLSEEQQSRLQEPIVAAMILRAQRTEKGFKPESDMIPSEIIEVVLDSEVSMKKDTALSSVETAKAEHHGLSKANAIPDALQQADTQPLLAAMCNQTKPIARMPIVPSKRNAEAKPSSNSQEPKKTKLDDKTRAEMD